MARTSFSLPFRNAALRRAGVLAFAAALSAPALAQQRGVAEPYLSEQSLDITGAVPNRNGSFFRLPSLPSEMPGVLVPVFRRLAADARRLRFEGENGVQEHAVFIRADQVAESARLRVRYVSAVSVMPEASRMSVFVNDRKLADVMLDAASEPGNADIDIPAGLLQAGYNSVRFSVQQRHRVDCSIEAATELWTQLDGAGTGLALVSTNDQFSTVEDLIAFPRDDEGGTPLHVVLAPGADIPAINQTLTAVQALAVRAGFAKPKIRFVREVDATPGIQIFVGSTASLRARGLDDSWFGEGGLSVAGRGSSVVRVVVSGERPEDVDTAILRLSSEISARGPLGSPAGLRALKLGNGAPLAPNSAITFDDLGLGSQEFSGRSFQTSFNVVLPSDFYAADNGKATLFLDAEYIAGLSSTNEALVRINGKVVGASRLAKSGGDVLSRRPIEITLRALQPGSNWVTLEVRTAADSDRDCNPLSMIEPSPRLRISGRSSFALPKVALIEHLPNLGATAIAGYPFSGASKPLTVFLPRADLASLGAAATLLARSAMAAGAPIETRLTLRVPDATTGQALIVGALADVPKTLLDHFEIKADMLPESWAKEKAAGGDAPRPQAAPLRTASLSPATRTDAAPLAAAPPAQAPSTQRLWDRWTDAYAQSDMVQGAARGLSRFLQRNIGYSAEQLAFLNGGRSATVAPPTATLLFAQAQAPSGGRDTWMLLTAGDAQSLLHDAASLVSPASWSQLGGRMVAYDPVGGDLTYFPVGSHYHFTLQDRTVGNITLFAAGWLSNHIKYYVLVLVALCGVFGFFSRKLLNRVGVRP